jgi:predicted nucleotidyltransferase
MKKKILQKQFQGEIENITKKLILRYKPEKIILYGSVALGKTYKWSDIDLVVIKKTGKNFYDRIGEVSGLVKHNVPIDFLVYTPLEFEKMAQENWFIKKEVMRKGKVIYGG